MDESHGLFIFLLHILHILLDPASMYLYQLAFHYFMLSFYTFHIIFPLYISLSDQFTAVRTPHFPLAPFVKYYCIVMHYYTCVYGVLIFSVL